MSLLSGIISGGTLLSAAIGAALDPSHHPFKRASVRPGGPRKQFSAQTHEWACEWMPPTKDATRQRCFNVAHPNRKPKVVRISKGYKKAYNKAYRRGKYPKAAQFHIDMRQPGASYKPRKSRTWAAASKKRASKKR